MTGKLGRRTLLKLAGATGVTILVRRASAQTENVLRVVQWKHFVPNYDKYFTEFANRFGEQNKCRVKVDYVATADLPAAIAADIANRGGHDVFHLNGTGAWLYEHVAADVTGVAERLANEFGGWIPETHSIGKVRDRWLAIPHWYVPFPFIINRDHFARVGESYGDRTTWQDVLRIGTKLKKTGYPFGIAYSKTPDSNDALLPLMLSFKAYMFDRAGNVDFRRKEIGEALEFGRSLYRQTMADEVMTWDDWGNNRLIISGKGSLICNPISAYRTAATENPDVFKSLEVVKTPLGPGGRANGARTMSYGVFNFSPVQDLAREFLYAMNKESLQGMLASTGYNHPFLRAFVKRPMPVIGTDPKLQLMQEYHYDLRFIGYPGPMTRKATAMYAQFIVPTMFAEVAKGRSPKAAMDEAEKKLLAL